MPAHVSPRQRDQHGNIYHDITLWGTPIGTVWKINDSRWRAEDPTGGIVVKQSRTQAVEVLEFWHRLRTRGATK